MEATDDPKTFTFGYKSSLSFRLNQVSDETEPFDLIQVSCPDCGGTMRFTKPDA